MTFHQAPDGSVTLQPSDAPTWQQYVTDFDSAVAQTNQSLSDLEGMTPPADPAALAEYNRLVAAGQDWVSKLEALKAQRDAVASWFSGLYAGAVDVVSRDVIEPAANTYGSAVDVVSRDVIEPIADFFSSGSSSSSSTTQGLGIVPLVIAGVAIAAFGAAVYGAIQWAEQTQRFRQVNAQAAAAIAAGQDPSTAYAAAAKNVNYTAGPPSPPLLQSLGTQLIWAAALVGLAFWLLPKLFDRLGAPSRE